MSEDLESVPARLRWYFELPGAWDSVKKEILEHDPTCVSLPHIWLPRTGGVSCPSDLGSCDDCGITFYNEGLLGQYAPDWRMGDPVLMIKKYEDEGDDEEYEATLCECCGRKRRTA